MTVRAVTISLCLQLVLWSDGNAQSVPEVEDGNRVRIRLTDKAGWHVGIYQGGVKDTLWIGQCVDCFAGHIPLSQIDELDVSSGLPRSRAKQTIYSGLIGLAVGAVAGGYGAVCTKGGSFDCQTLQTLSAEIFGAIGAVLGIVIGAVLPTPREHWHKTFPS